VARLKTILRKAQAGPWFRPWPNTDTLDERLTARWQEFQAARQHTIPQLLTRLAAQPLSQPLWVEGQTLFRFAHPLDPPAVWQEQRAVAAQARQRLTAGEAFATVAAEMSQGGTRALGGTLGHRLLDPAEAEDRLLAGLPVGAVSPVSRAADGFRLYRLATRGGGEEKAWHATPWPARRILFRRELARALNGGGQ